MLPLVPPRSLGRFALSRVTDAPDLRYAVREPTGPAEIGRLHRLLSESGLQPAGTQRHLVVLDGMVIAPSRVKVRDAEALPH